MAGPHAPRSTTGLFRALALLIGLVAVSTLAGACTGSPRLTTVPPTTASSPAPLLTTSPPATPSPTPFSFASTLYGISFVLPPGWVAHAPAADHESLESPTGQVTLMIGTGQPEPGQTVADRVRINRAEEFGPCETDPASDREVSVGGEPGILWTFRCGQIVGLAANTIHGGTGYRLTLKTTVSEAGGLEAMMLGVLREFAFSD